MNEFQISLYGVAVRVRSAKDSYQTVLEDLASDFAALRVPADAHPQIVVELVDKTPSQLKPLPPRLCTGAKSTVHGLGVARICDYSGGVRADCKTIDGQRQFWISGHNLSLVREVTYKFLLSAIGEDLDRRGYHRVHALGLQAHDLNLLMLAPSGAGKSALANLCLRTSQETRLFSDENPLLRSDRIYPYPLRLALAPDVVEGLNLSAHRLYERQLLGQKCLIDFPVNRLASPGQLHFLFIGVVDDSTYPRIKARRRFYAIVPLLEGLVVGHGLAQMAEWMLRMPNLFGLLRILQSRIFTMTKLLMSPVKVYEFRMSRDARANARCLQNFLNQLVG